MQMQNRIKRIKLIVMICAAAFVGSSLFGQQTPASAAQEQPRRALEFVATGVPMETRAGVDDGAAFAVHFFGSTNGLGLTTEPPSSSISWGARTAASNRVAESPPGWGDWHGVSATQNCSRPR